VAATQTLAQMRTRARRRADMETGSAAAFVSDAEFNELINNGCQELFDLLQAARGHDYFITGDLVLMTPGTAQYSLPDDYYQTRTIQASTNNTDWRTVRAWDWREHAELTNRGPTGSHSNIRARIVDGDMFVLPVPASAFIIRHWYVYAFTRLTADSATFDGINGWEEYAVLYAAIAALKKEESLEQAQALEAEFGRYAARIERLASSRHQTEPDRVQDTRRDHVARWSAADLVNSGISEDGLP
jgi:hypothetical protein